MEAKGFVVPPGGGAVWDMEPGRSAALKLLGGQTAESVMLSFMGTRASNSIFTA